MTLAETMSMIERQVRARFRREMPDGRFGHCGGCDRHHDEDGTPLFVRRRIRGRLWLCLQCFDERSG